MSGQTVVITGASDGIGAAAARRLATRGETVVLVGRDPSKTSRVAAELDAKHYVADFADFGQVRALAAVLQAKHPRIDVLVNNAGAIMPSFARTVDGHERTLQVNHLAPFLLTNLMLPVLRASGATVITTASDEAKKGRIDPDHLDDLDASAFRPKQVYADTKLANVLFTEQLQAREGTQGVTAVAFHPGIVASNFAADTTTNWRWVYNTPLRHMVLTKPDKAIRTLLWLLDSRSDNAWTPGAFYASNKIVAMPEHSDPALATKLWDASTQLVRPDPSSA